MLEDYRSIWPSTPDPGREATIEWMKELLKNGREGVKQILTAFYLTKEGFDEDELENPDFQEHLERFTTRMMAAIEEGKALNDAESRIKKN